MLLNEIIAIVFFAIILMAAIISIDGYRNSNKVEFDFKDCFENKNIILIDFDFLIEGKTETLSFVLDTGSMNNIISEKVLLSLDKREKTDNTYDSDGCNSTEYGLSEYYLEFYFGNYLFIDKFISSKAFVNQAKVCKENYGVNIAGMIGSEFLNSTNANINFKTKKVTLWKK